MNMHRASRKASFDETMAEATRLMPLRQRIFSKIVHIGILSSMSDAIGRTVARPNPLLFGAVCSFAFTLTTYLLAKNLGYSLSGFESVIAFFIGWFTGLLYDLLKTALTGKR